MRIDIRSTNLDLSDDFLADAEARTYFVLGRFAPVIREVSAVLTDVNGPRGGDDKVCRVTIVATEGWSVTLSDVGTLHGRVLARAVRRARHVFARNVARRRERSAS